MGDMRAEVGTWRAKAEELNGEAGVRGGNERVFGSSAEGVRAEVGTSCTKAGVRSAKAEARRREAGGTCAGVQKNRSHMRGTVRAVGYGAHSAGEGRKLSKGIV